MRDGRTRNTVIAVEDVSIFYRDIIAVDVVSVGIEWELAGCLRCVISDLIHKSGRNSLLDRTKRQYGSQLNRSAKLRGIS